jgi:hypothetical protein
MVDDVPAETAFDTKVPVIGSIGGSMGRSIGCGIGEDPLDAPFLRTEGEKTAAGTVRAGGSRLGQLPCLHRRIEAIRGDRSHRTGVEALTAELTFEGAVKVGVDGGFDPSFRERKLSDSLDLIADPDTPPAEDTLVSISLDEGREIVSGEGDLRPGVLGLFHAVFVD